ncbi:MAG: hypothetical protein JSW58_13845 [Candidatus Latescibacterota bacterium]|nr:MAG: hypothetical protein JSW58_13845 [Candidatus Latescibacterota bacterium]
MVYRDATDRHNWYDRRFSARVCVGILCLLVLILPAQGFAGEKGALVRSLLIPGLGQAHQGHYTRAAIFAGSAVVSGFGLVVSHIHYNQAVDKYRDRKRTYFSYEDQLESGQIVSFEEINGTYQAMETAWDEAEDRLMWRNVFLGALVATYAVNIVDVLISKPHKLDSGNRLAIDVNRDRFLVVKTIRF